jgi:hypothetical protein
MTQTDFDRAIQKATAHNTQWVQRTPGKHVVQWRRDPPEELFDWLNEHGIAPHTRELVSYRGFKSVPDQSRSSGFRAQLTNINEIAFDHANDALLCWMAFSDDAAQPFEVDEA